MADDVPQIMSPREAADFLRLPVSTIWNLLRAGIIPARRWGKQYRIARDVLEAMVRGETLDRIGEPPPNRSDYGLR